MNFYWYVYLFHSLSRTEVNYCTCRSPSVYPLSCWWMLRVFQCSSSWIMLQWTCGQVPPGVRVSVGCTDVFRDTETQHVEEVPQAHWGTGLGQGGWLRGGAEQSWLWDSTHLSHSRFASLLYGLAFRLTLCLKNRFCFFKKKFENKLS